MDLPPTVAFTALVEVWPRATETKIGAALCAIGAVWTLTFDKFHQGLELLCIRAISLTANFWTIDTIFIILFHFRFV